MKFLRSAAWNTNEFSGTSMRSRRARLRASLASGIALSAAVAATPAYAGPNECGPPVDGEVTCTPDENPYPTGIQYFTPGSLVVNLTEGVVVEAPTSATGVTIVSSNGGDATINAAAATSISAQRAIEAFSDAVGSNSAVTVNNGAILEARISGIRASADGTSIVNNTGDVTIPVGATTSDSTRAVFAFSRNADVSITNSGAILMEATGFNNIGIFTNAFGAGAVTQLTNTGPVTITGNNFTLGVSSQSFGEGGQVSLTNSGAVTIQREQSDSVAVGIRVLANDGVTTADIVNSGAITIDGASSGTGILSFVNGDTTITSSGPITVTADRASGISAQALAETGNVVVNATGIVQANSTQDAAPAPAINQAGGIFTTAIDGSTTITAGTVQTTGNGTPGISAGSEAGSISITSANVSTAGLFSDGIAATTTTGAVTIRSGAVTTTGEDSRGITIFSDSGTIDIGSAGAVATSGDRSSGIVAQTDGDVLVSNTGSVSTTGADSGAIFAFSSGGGDVAITGRGAVTTSGVNSFGVAGASSGDGNISIQTGAVSTSGDNAIGVGGASDDGSVAIDATAVSTAGADSDAVAAASGTGDVSVTTGTVQTTGAGSVGIRAVSTAGNVSVISNNLSTAGGLGATGTEAFGILATSNTGNVGVTSTGALSTAGQDADGIFATAGGTVLVNNTGAITTSGDAASGIFASADGDAAVTGRGTVTTTGVGSHAIDVRSADGDASVQTGAVSATGQSAVGIIAIASNGTATVDATTVAGSSAGIVTQGLTASVTATTVSTTEDGAAGISVNNTTAADSGPITVNSGSITTVGDFSPAIRTVSSGGPTTITSTGAIRTSGESSAGIDAVGGVITVNNTGSITTAGANSRGITLFGGGGDLTLTGRGTVTTTGSGSTGISAVTTDGNVSVQTGAVSTSGNDAVGILASANGSTIVDATTVATAGERATGIIARGQDVQVTSTAVTTSGANANGITAEATTGPVVVNSQSSIVTGVGSSAIQATSIEGPVTVTSRTARSVFGNGILATSDTGPVAVTITGFTTSSMQAAVNVQAGTTATINVTSTGNVTGAAGILVDSGTSTTITNAGLIEALGGGFAVDASGGPATITNTGTITGALRLTGGNDTLTNGGIFNVTGASEFGAGNDVVTNSGTIVANSLLDFGAGNDVLTNSGTVFANADMGFGAGTDTINNSGVFQVLLNRPVGTVTLANLEAFNNSGLVDLRNGRTGDVLSMPGVFNGTGNSRVGLDVDFGTNVTADQLRVGSAVGSTQLNLAVTGPARLGTGPVLVQGGAGTSATAFSLAPIQDGLVQLQLGFANNGFSLVGTPSDAAFRTTAFAGAFRDLWHESADAWSAQMREGRDTAFGGNAGDPGARFWMQGHARLSEHDSGGSFTAFGQTRDVDLSYDQDFFGGQIGLDFGGAVGEQGGFAFGVTGGYVDSNVNFEGAGDNFEMQAVNVGAYGRFSTGMFFVNALAKYDHILDVSSRSIIGDFAAELDGNLYGGKVEAGLRFGGNGLWVEPIATISYVNSDLDGFAVRGTTVEFDTEHGLRGSLGGRVGSSFGISHSATASVYAGAHYVHEFGDSDEVLLASGATNLRLTALEDEDHVKALVGINIANAGPVSGFIEGNGEFLNDRQGMGVRGGIRIRF